MNEYFASEIISKAKKEIIAAFDEIIIHGYGKLEVIVAADKEQIDVIKSIRTRTQNHSEGLDR